MSKRPSIDLVSLTSEAAVPMAEAAQRTAPELPVRAMPTPAPAPSAALVPTVATESTKTANLQALAFKVPPAFRKRFRQRAASADLKLNELLFAAFEAWEEKQGFKR